MPLRKSKSKEAFKDNLKAEMKAGKPQKQALAIAYSVKRHAKAKGGEIMRDPIRSKEKQLNSMAEAHEASCPACMAQGGEVLYPHSPNCPQNTSGELSAESKGLAKYARGGEVLRSGSPTMDKAANNGPIPKSKEQLMSDELDRKSKAYEESRPDSLDEMANSPIGDEQQYDSLPPLRGEQSLMDEVMKRRRMAEGGMVDRNDDVSDPMEADESGMSDLRFISTDTNDFKDRDDVKNPDHDAGAVDEREDESLAGMAMKRRRRR